jgi:hypothetical protein
MAKKATKKAQEWTEGDNGETTPTLSPQDLEILVKFVDVCCKRGAFDGGELEAIGGARNRIVALLHAQPKGIKEGF